MTRLTKLLAAFRVSLALGLGGAGFGGTALAGPLGDAKAAGWLGERSDGYLGVVSEAPVSAAALAADINAKRRAKYQGIAAANGTSLAAVEMLVGEKLIARAKPGEIVMNANGQWVRR